MRTFFNDFLTLLSFYNIGRGFASTEIGIVCEQNCQTKLSRYNSSEAQDFICEQNCRKKSSEFSFLLYHYMVKYGKKKKGMENKMKAIYQFWITNHVFLYVIGGLALLGCLSKIILAVHYQRSIKGVRLRKGKNKLFKRINLEIGQVNNVEDNVVHNVDNFVDKCVYYDKIGKVRLYFFEETGRIMLITYGILLTAVAFCGYLYREDFNNLLTLLTSGILGILLVFFMDAVLCVRRKKQFFRCILKEYCEEELHISGKQEENIMVEEMEGEKEKILSGQEEELVKKVEEWKEREPVLRDTDVISEALNRQMSELVEEGAASREKEKEQEQFEKTWDLKEIIAATQEKMKEQERIKEQEGQVRKKQEKEQIPQINLSERDEKIIMDILREYL